MKKNMKKKHKSSAVNYMINTYKSEEKKHNDAGIEYSFKKHFNRCMNLLEQPNKIAYFNLGEDEYKEFEKLCFDEYKKCLELNFLID